MSRREHFTLEERVRIGINVCKTNCALNCGRCPYYDLKDEENNSVDACTSALMADTEKFIDKLLGNSIYVYGAYYTEGENNE